MRGSVRGTVVRAENDDPIADVMIMGTPGPGEEGGASSRAPISARSDPSGGFGFDNLPEGEWVFTSQGSHGEILGEATVHVFDNALSDVTIAVHGIYGGSPVYRDADPSKAHKKARPLLGGVRGRVVRDINGKAVAGATIAVVSGEGSEPDIAPVSDADGWFALDGLPEGEWLLRALGRAGETGTATVHVFDNALSDVTIEVGGLPRPPRRGGGTRPSNRSERSMRGSLRGRVIRMESSRPVADATITVVTGPGPAPDIAPMTNRDGVFSFDGLPPGEWVLRAMTPEGGTGEGTGRVTAGAVADMIIYVR